MKTILYFCIFLEFQQIFAQNTTILPDRVTIPKMNTATKNALPNKVEGMMVYDSDLQQFSYWTGTAWANFGSTVASATGWQQVVNDISTTNSGNVGVGISPTKAKFEVSTSNTTQAVFGSNSTGLSIQQNMPTIGFNQYRDASSVERYIGSGFAASNYLDVNSGYLNWSAIPSGTVGLPTASETNIMSLTNAGNLVLLSGQSNNSSPLIFPNTLGNKISFWHDGSNQDYGIGIKSATLAIYTGLSTEKVSFGYGNANNFTETMKINTGSGQLFSSQTGNLNLVPIGIVSYNFTTSDCSFSSSNVTNVVGSLVQTSVTSFLGCDHSGIITQTVMNFNTAIASQYSKIIAINSPTLDIDPTNQFGTFKTNCTTSLFAITTLTYGGLSYLGTVSNSYTGTVMFYGIK